MVSLVQFGALCVGGGQGPSNYDRCTFFTKRYSDDVVSVGPTNVCRFVSILIEIPMNCALQVNSIIGDFPILKVQEAMQYLKKEKESSIRLAYKLKDKILYTVGKIIYFEPMGGFILAIFPKYNKYQVQQMSQDESLCLHSSCRKCKKQCKLIRK